MNIKGLLKKNKVVEIKEGEETFSFTLKKFPYGFWEHFNSVQQSLFTEVKVGEGTKKVYLGGFYDPEMKAEILDNGLESWSLLDENGYAIEKNIANCLALVKDFPDLAQKIETELVSFLFGANEENNDLKKNLKKR